MQDARTAAQKAEADAATRRESSVAHAMEKARRQEEARLQAANAVTLSKDKKSDPDYFTVRDATAERPKAGASKSKQPQHPAVLGL